MRYPVIEEHADNFPRVIDAESLGSGCPRHVDDVEPAVRAGERDRSGSGEYLPDNPPRIADVNDLRR